MSAPSAKLLVSVEEKERCAFVKITGRANFASSVDFKKLVAELLAKGYGRFVIDLTDCVLMDSTFLGVLAGSGLKVNAPQANGSQRFIELFNPNARVKDLLENLGVLDLFRVAQGDTATPDGAQSREMSPSDASRAEITRTCLEAHQLLMNINPANVARFKDVAQFLAEDLKKLEAGS